MNLWQTKFKRQVSTYRKERRTANETSQQKLRELDEKHTALSQVCVWFLFLCAVKRTAITTPHQLKALSVYRKTKPRLKAGITSWRQRTTMRTLPSVAQAVMQKAAMQPSDLAT